MEGGGPGVLRLLNELVQGIVITNGGLLHFGYMCMLAMAMLAGVWTSLT